MVHITRESYLLIFEVLCFISTACLISRCIHQYYLDDDTSQLEYRKFHHDAGSIYPSISICFPSSSFFDYSAIHKTVMSIPKLARQVSKKCGYSGIGCNSQYLKLLGEIVEVIDYSNVTLQLMKHVSIVEINLQNNGKILWSNEEGKLKLSEAFETILSNGFMIQRNLTDEKIDSIPEPKIYPSHQAMYRKCYSIDVPFIKGIQIINMRLRIKGSIFKDDNIRPSKNEFGVKFHYPNQQLMSISAQTSWASKFNFSTFYQKDIYLGYIEVLQTRNKHSRPCHNKDHDKYIIEEVTKLLGCRIHDSKIMEQVPWCKEYALIRAFDYETTKRPKIPPCRSLISVYDWYTESDRSDENIGESQMDLIFHYPNDLYKEVIYSKEYSLEALIGNIGGYIGKPRY